jgi:hypothetical protein
VRPRRREERFDAATACAAPFTARETAMRTRGVLSGFCSRDVALVQVGERTPHFRLFAVAAITNAPGVAAATVVRDAA